MTYSVKQYIPNLLGQSSFNFQQVYGSQSGYAKCGNISQFILSDNINNNYDISDVRVFRNDQDVTGNFWIYQSGNYVKATAMICIFCPMHFSVLRLHANLNQQE